MTDDTYKWEAEVTESVCNFDDTQISDSSEQSN